MDFSDKFWLNSLDKLFKKKRLNFKIFAISRITFLLVFTSDSGFYSMSHFINIYSGNLVIHLYLIWFLGFGFNEFPIDCYLKLKLLRALIFIWIGNFDLMEIGFFVMRFPAPPSSRTFSSHWLHCSSVKSTSRCLTKPREFLKYELNPGDYPGAFRRIAETTECQQ